MKEKKLGKKGIIFLVFILLLTGIGGIFYCKYNLSINFSRFDKLNDFERNMNSPNTQLDNSQIQEVILFFENSTQSELLSYCEQSRDSCFYYCKKVNSSNQYCVQIMNPNQGGVPPEK